MKFNLLLPLTVMILSLSSCNGGATPKSDEESKDEPSISETKTEESNIDESSIESITSDTIEESIIESEEESEELSENESVTEVESESEIESNSEEETISEESNSEEESIKEDNYQIDEDRFNLLFHTNEMVSPRFNFTCELSYKTFMDDTYYVTFLLDEGDIRIDTTASYNLSEISSEYYQLISFVSPASTYYYYTYSAYYETWDRQELNTDFSIFYYQNLGLFVDLKYSDLTFDDTSNVYKCSHLKAYPYAGNTTIFEYYDNIEISFVNELITSIKYTNKELDYTLIYKDYGSTVVDVPVL